MATRAWDEETESEVWIVEPELLNKDPSLDSAYSSDSEATINSMETIQSTDVIGKSTFN
jgi:hypothetical protein